MSAYRIPDGTPDAFPRVVVRVLDAYSLEGRVRADTVESNLSRRAKALMSG